MASPIQLPFPMFFDSDGAPLDRGYVYIGISGLNPISNPQQVFSDVGLTTPMIGPLRTSAGYVVYNGSPACPYVAGDYSMVVQDQRGKVVYSTLVNAVAAADLLMTQSRGTLARAMRVPPSYNVNLILVSGFYSWISASTSNMPAGCAAGDSFTLEVLASPDGGGLVVQKLIDLTLATGITYYRQSVDGGTTWISWLTATVTVGTNWSAALTATLGADWASYFAAKGPRAIVKTSGALGTLTVTSDTTYILSNATTCTLPASPKDGQCLTFKNKGIFNTVISANAGQTIGTTSSTGFSLYAQEDYVTLEWDGTSIWYVVATNGPVLTADQTAILTCNNSSVWTAIGVGLSLGTLAPGIYDLELSFTCSINASGSLGLALGNGLTPLGNSLGFYFNTAAVAGGQLSLKNYTLNTGSTIQALYLSSSTANYIVFNGVGGVTTRGRLTARRIG